VADQAEGTYVSCLAVVLKPWPILGAFGSLAALLSCPEPRQRDQAFAPFCVPLVAAADFRSGTYFERATSGPRHFLSAAHSWELRERLGMWEVNGDHCTTVVLPGEEEPEELVD
jgi:hypothetical protein